MNIRIEWAESHRQQGAEQFAQPVGADADLSIYRSIYLWIDRSIYVYIYNISMRHRQKGQEQLSQSGFADADIISIYLSFFLSIYILYMYICI